MIGDAFTAVMVSAVELPSGAAMASAATEPEPPFLSLFSEVKDYRSWT
jgi:hypothetical protein